ncbi:unnamed protein product [Diabrotica balteata]|uniref:Uncharacterized protein n=1 Tax=Diabrotica balteata TaxID=107213 RepID=A0A9N9XBX8_DIABA|nr:unnamed protein product [Diabrotica balteata]
MILNRFQDMYCQINVALANIAQNHAKNSLEVHDYILAQDNYGLVIIFSSDAVTLESQKIIDLAYKELRKRSTTKLQKEELKRLVVKVKYYVPSLTAAKFFKINRNTILGLISVATTYSIVIIQLGDSNFDVNNNTNSTN